jgi:FkbM family methyltransferase
MKPTTDAAVDHQSPWGRHAPSAWRGAMLSIAHAVPAHWGQARRIVRIFRDPIRYARQACYDVTIWGLRLRLTDQGNRSERRLLYAPQMFDPEERALLARQLKPGATFVDIGANVGAFTYWAHHCMQGSGRIVAVEPDEEMRARLEFNLRTNGMRHVDVVSAALSDHTGTAVLYVDRGQRGRNTLESAVAEATGGDRVAQTVPLDTLWARLTALGVDRIDALKIDIEGHEVPVMRHFFAHAPRSAWPQVLLTECAHDASDELHALVEGAGYRCVMRTELNRGYTLDAAG